MKEKLAKIQKLMKEGKEAEANAVASDGKAHAPSWLLGRTGTKSVSTSTKASTAQQVQDLTEKINVLESELEAKFNKKLQENMAWMVKKLGEATPGMIFNLEDVCATVSRDKEENGTLVTQGTQGATS
ncbi:uncharacterized protein LOC141710913 isoform X2 [Apium graveolens]|uniref:uncharacterized protein LOC141710913 isoform X2 n=1 Tax=Apium graveolens TaxID=4045 RepID=UPI003D7B76CC